MTDPWIEPARLRVSDAERDEVVEVLHTAYAQGRIDGGEHSERLEAALRAKTFGDLAPLTADLVPAPPGASAPRRTGSPASAPASTAASSQASSQPDRMAAVLSEVTRAGPWRVRRRSVATVFLGSVQLDLTQAVFEAPVVEVDVTLVLGSLHLRVPPGVTVRDEMSHVLDEFTTRGVGPGEPGRPTVVLRGTSLLGEIKVRGPRKPTPWRRALGGGTP